MLKIMIAQFSQIKPNDKSLNKYLSSAFKKQKIDLVVFGEYVSSPFFKEINAKKSQTKALEKQFKALEAYFMGLAQKYNAIFVVPMLKVSGEKIYKSTLFATSKKAIYQNTQKLMKMPHWDEAAFFNNRNTSKIEIPILEINGIKIASISGWESHFDEFWLELKNKNADVVIVPTASTFGSNERWERLLRTRSFVNNCCVVRVNRIGKYVENNIDWQFYGESFIALPDGNVGDILGDREGILVSEIKKSQIDSERKVWGFR